MNKNPKQGYCESWGSFFNFSIHQCCKLLKVHVIGFSTFKTLRTHTHTSSNHMERKILCCISSATFLTGLLNKTNRINLDKSLGAHLYHKVSMICTVFIGYWHGTTVHIFIVCTGMHQSILVCVDPFCFDTYWYNWNDMVSSFNSWFLICSQPSQIFFASAQDGLQFFTIVSPNRIWQSNLHIGHNNNNNEKKVTLVEYGGLKRKFTCAVNSANKTIEDLKGKKKLR